MVVEGTFTGGAGFVSLSLDERAQLKVNGQAVVGPGLRFGGQNASYFSVEDKEFTAATLSFGEVPADRDWPEFTSAFSRQSCTLADHAHLRLAVERVLEQATTSALLFQDPNFVRMAEDGLLLALDQAFRTGSRDKPPTLATGRYLRICAMVSEFTRTRAPHQPTTSEIAAAVGASVRTLHNAMIAVFGVSLQAYLFEQRIWSARKELLATQSQKKIKTIAIDNGFFHFGRFSTSYKRKFGESPSETVIRRL